MDKKNALISVIVPIYNIEKYLGRCIESICKQTYSNLEIILVDDGSPDNCGLICDQYAEKDSRIHVIHKMNGGVSSARNAGMEVASGDYIIFSDGDDYIHPEMYQKLIENLERNQADISICGFFNEDSAGIFHRYSSERELVCLSQAEQLECLLKVKRFCWSVCDKLLKKDLVAAIRFDETISNNEDLKFLYQVMKRSKKAVFSSEPYYFYCSNGGSATTSCFNKKKMTIIDVWDHILADVQKCYPKLKSCARTEYVKNNLMCARWAVLDQYQDRNDLKRLKKNTQKNLLFYLFSYSSFGYKLQALTLTMGYPLFNKLERRRKQ